MEATMRRYVSGVLVGVVITCFAASSAFAAEDPRNELAEINATLKDIAHMLKQQVETQKADLLLKRVSLSTTQLSNARERLIAIDREIALGEKDRSEMESILANNQKLLPAGDARITEIKSQWQAIQDRLSALRQERITVQNDVEALRREVREWQSLLDKTLTNGS
jgi:chromosome segregation ATPase